MESINDVLLPQAGVNEKYYTVKVPLKKILRPIPGQNDKMLDIVDRANHLVSYTYYFLRLWIIKRYDNDLVIPTINRKLVTRIFRLLSNGGAAGRLPNLDDIDNDMLEFYNEKFISTGFTDQDKIEATGFPQILKMQALSMVTLT